MRILFNGVMEEASILATNQSLNYPVGNLVHPFLQKRFQSSSTESVITAVFDEDQCLNCIFYGYHTLQSMTVVFKDSLDAVLYTLNLSSLDDIGVSYFDKIGNVRSIEITIGGDLGFYVGRIDLGCYYQMPDPLADYEPGNEDNTSSSISSSGQVLSNDVEPLRELSYEFKDISIATKNEINTLYKSVSIMNPIFFDLYEDAREKEEPIYAYFTSPLSFPYTPTKYSFDMKIREAR